MAYESRGIIDIQDYWAFLDCLNNVWGAGSGSNGYGQSSLANTLTSGTTVTAAQWATLISRLDTVRNHQIGATSGITAPSAGNVIAFNQSLTNAINNVVHSRFATNTRGTAAPTALGNPAMANNTVWSTRATKEFNVTFANTNAARWFFNSGGLVTFYGNLVGNTGLKSAGWYDLLNINLGTVSIGANTCTRSGSGGDFGNRERYILTESDPVSYTFRYVRWVVTTTRTASSTLSVSEFVLQNNSVDISMAGSTVLVNQDLTGSSAALVDNNTSTNITTIFSGTNNRIITIDLGTNQTFNGYRWATTSGASSQDPISWVLQVSDDNQLWYTVDTVNNFSTTTSRSTYVGPFALTNRIGFNSNAGPNTGAPLVFSGGYSNLSATYSTLVQIGSTDATYDYTQNYVIVEGRTVSNGIGLRLTLMDAASDGRLNTPQAFYNPVNGNIQVYVGFTPPETTFLSNVWGAPSSTTVTNTQF